MYRLMAEAAPLTRIIEAGLEQALSSPDSSGSLLLMPVTAGAGGVMGAHG